MTDPDSVPRCSCLCPESTHTGPGGHCTRPECTTEPCTPITEVHRAQRHERYARAITEHLRGSDEARADAVDTVLAVADDEQANLRNAVRRLLRSLSRGLDARDRAKRLTAFLDVVALELEHWDGEKSLALLRRELDTLHRDLGALDARQATPAPRPSPSPPRWTVKPETLRYAEQIRKTPGPQTADGHTGWECTAGASLIIHAMTPGPGRLGTLHGCIYTCPDHQADAEARITASGANPDISEAPPGHRWNPWPCGHTTVHGRAAQTVLATFAKDHRTADRPDTTEG